jgi:hypothetical protein
MSTNKKSTLDEGRKGATDHVEYFDPKIISDSNEKLDNGSAKLSNEEEKSPPKNIDSPRDLVSEVLVLEDDPSLNPWTFRMWFLGICFSLFAS